MSNYRKVSIIGSAYPLRGGGIATFNERLAKAFQDAGKEVIIHTFSLQYPGFLFPGKTQYSDEAPPKTLDIRVQVNSINPFNWILVGLKIKKLKPDLVVIRYWIPFMGPCLGTIARIIRRNKHSRVIAITDNVIPHEKRPGDRLFSAFFVNSMDGFVTLSKSVLDDLATFDKIKPKSYCPHPLYDNYGAATDRLTALAALDLSPDYQHLLFFGFIREYKGLDLLLQALTDTRLRQLPLKLIVAGEFYTDSKPYLDFIDSHQLGDKVILRTNFLSDQEVSLYFSAADLVVQPYKTATQSGVTQVAYHFNVPMLTTRVGGLSELVPHGKAGYVVEPDPARIADAIVDFFSSGKQAEFKENIATIKLGFSWEKLIDTIETVARTPIE